MLAVNSGGTKGDSSGEPFLRRPGRHALSTMMSAIRTSLHLSALTLSACLMAGCANGNAINLPLSDRGNIQLPADTAKPLFDLLTFDGRRNLLYVAHTSNNTIDIVDTQGRKVLASIPGIAGVKQVALTADPDVVFASASAGGEVVLIDTRAMKVLARISVNGSPDAIDYDSGHDTAVVASAGAKELSLIDRATRKVTSTIKLPGTPELLTVDPKGGRAFVSINDKDEVAVVDLVTSQVTELRGCDIKAPTGIAYDGDQDRLFVADRGLVSVIDVLIDHAEPPQASPLYGEWRQPQSLRHRYGLTPAARRGRHWTQRRWRRGGSRHRFGLCDRGTCRHHRRLSRSLVARHRLAR